MDAGQILGDILEPASTYSLVLLLLLFLSVPTTQYTSYTINTTDMILLLVPCSSKVLQLLSIYTRIWPQISPRAVNMSASQFNSPGVDFCGAVVSNEPG